MGEVILRDLVVQRESKSFTDSLYAVLTAAGRFKGPKFMLSALSGMAFIFSVHKRLLSFSVTAYGNWGTVHKRAAYSLGVYTASDGGRTRHPTFQHYQQEAVQWIKSSIDVGLGAIYWIPEFGVIHGYDDDDRIFYVQDGHASESRILLYDNFGINCTPFWNAQIFGENINIPAEDMALEALRLALDEWESPYPVMPNQDIASGRLAYAYLIQALEQGDYDEFGAMYILDTFRVSRKEIKLFLQEAVSLFPDLQDACLCYDKIADMTEGLDLWVVSGTDGRKVNRSDIPALVAMLKEARDLEEQSMDIFKQLSGRYPDLQRTTVPRWGLHTAR
ncbi:hypothetical protein [Paenibacillus sp.]|uniref:hypothetical protein n=1 Tax=Paenibacillus sp. TaxID=58172 RepID=UPI0028355CDD|nr:hypothetical protein [Paenibacillus sp.]MDR0268575.1 BtrH N-terminal domain-containing protein [Paenibacillus sp.]